MNLPPSTRACGLEVLVQVVIAVVVLTGGLAVGVGHYGAQHLKVEEARRLARAEDLFEQTPRAIAAIAPRIASSGLAVRITATISTNVSAADASAHPAIDPARACIPAEADPGLPVNAHTKPPPATSGHTTSTRTVRLKRQRTPRQRCGRWTGISTS